MTQSAPRPGTDCQADRGQEKEWGDSVLAKDKRAVEAGASPLEEYNGAALAGLLGSHVCFTLLCASDPYAVAGLMDAFGTKPDLVAGGAANTTAGAGLVERLTGLTALNLADPRTHAELRERLASALASFRP